MTAYSKNRSQYFCRTGRERASWEIAALALILSLIFGYSPASAHSLSPDIILQNPGQFDNKQVAVTGTVRDLQHRASHGAQG